MNNRETLSVGIKVEVIGGVIAGLILIVLGWIWKSRSGLARIARKALLTAFDWLRASVWLPRWTAFLIGLTLAYLVIAAITRARRNSVAKAAQAQSKYPAINVGWGTMVPAELEIKMLKCVAEQSPNGSNEGDLLQIDGAPRLRAEESLAQLTRYGLIDPVGGHGRPIRYNLTENGRSYLVRADLV